MLQNGLRFWFEQNSNWKITRNYKQIKCVMYSMYDTAGYILQAKNSEAKGYISKVASEEISDELFISMHSVHNYVTYMYTLADVHNRAEFLEKFGKK